VEPEKQPLLGNESASSNGGTTGGGVFYVATQRDLIRAFSSVESLQSAARVYGWRGMVTSVQGHEPGIKQCD
jgi:hypothetical protein